MERKVDIKIAVKILTPLIVAIGLNYFIFFRLETTHWIWLLVLTIMEWFRPIMAPFMILSRPPFFLGIVAIVSVIIFLEGFLSYILLFTTKKNHSIFLIGIVTVLSTILMFYAFFGALGGQAYFEEQPATYIYTISVQGLSNYSGGLGTDIIVPIPMRKGEQIFNDEEMQNKSFGNWTSMLVVTNEGKMLAFQTRDKNLTNIDARFRKDVNYSIDLKNIMDNALLYPISNYGIANYTIWIYSDKNVQNYTTYVYIDQNIQPLKSDNNTITFNLGFALRGNMVHGRAINYQVDVFEAIPESVKGPIPVKAQLAVVGETGWGPLRLNSKSHPDREKLIQVA